MKDIDKAWYYYKLSANQNNSDAQLGLGIIYFYDEYGRKDINKAIHYFNLSANQNNSEAEIFLAFIYLYGHYVPKDENKAIYYLSLPENKDDTKAQILLGMIYSKKISTNQLKNQFQKQICYLDTFFIRVNISKKIFKKQFIISQFQQTKIINMLNIILVLYI